MTSWNSEGRGDAIGAIAAGIRREHHMDQALQASADVAECQSLREMVILWDDERRDAANRRLTEAAALLQGPCDNGGGGDDAGDTAGRNGGTKQMIADSTMPSTSTTSTASESTATSNTVRRWRRSFGDTGNETDYIDRASVCELPIFETQTRADVVGGGVVQTLFPISGPDSRLILGPADPNTTVYAEFSSWDAVLRSSDGERLVSLHGDENQQLCKLASRKDPPFAPRPPSTGTPGNQRLIAAR